jgi:hypothetical protein
MVKNITSRLPKIKNPLAMTLDNIILAFSARALGRACDYDVGRAAATLLNKNPPGERPAGFFR